MQTGNYAAQRLSGEHLLLGLLIVLLTIYPTSAQSHANQKDNANNRYSYKLVRVLRCGILMKINFNGSGSGMVA
jgi:hypothetical protein